MEIHKLEMKKGMTLKLKGKINNNANQFFINLGCGPKDLALHFNPRFGEKAIVCNSQNGGNWEKEHRDSHMCFQQGMEIKLIVTFDDEEFQVKLPDDHEVKFPNRSKCSNLSYLSVSDGIQLISFKLE
ncbi:galectin-2 [Macrotis lagotis]|uniref:galectin-2 n=1 Tax=Macrotis lagotis TaxID=92651 RepID=UPI003D6895E7